MLYTPAFWALFCSNFLTTSSFGAFFLFPLFISEQGGGEAEIGLVMGVFALSSALCRPWVSNAIDRMGRRRAYALGCFIMTVLPLAYFAFLDGIHLLPLLFVRILHGIGLAISFTAVFTFVADLVPVDRLNEGIGIFGVSGLTGLAVGPFIAEGILKLSGYPAFFLLASSLAGIAFCLVLSLPEGKRGEGELLGPSFFALLFGRKFVVVAILSAFFGFALAATGNFVAPLAHEKGISFISRFYIAYSLAAVSVRIPGGRLTDRVGERRVLPYALITCSLGLFALAVASRPLTLFVAGLLSGAGHGLLFPVLNTLAIRDEPFENRGKATGIFTGAIDAGNFTGSFLLGWVGETFGIESLFVLAGVVLVLGLFAKVKRSPAVP